MLSLGLIGYGYWGPNLARNFAELRPRIRLAGIADLRPDRRQLAANRYPECNVTADHNELMDDPNIQVIVIATPVSAHFMLAMQALRAGKHVFIEKPMATTSGECQQLIDYAKSRGLVVMVDHPFIYTGAVRKIEELIRSGDLGDILYFDSVRINLGLFQNDVNVIYDLAVHDISILYHLLHQMPTYVNAVGVCHTGTGIENTAYISAQYENNLLAHIHVNWLSPVKVRRTLIGGTKRMVVYDDVEPSEKVKVYDRGVTLRPNETNTDPYRYLTEYRVGDMYAPKLDQSEALFVAASHLIDCIEGGKTPITDGQAGLEVVRMLEAASQSLSANGPIYLPAKEVGSSLTYETPRSV